MRFKTIQLCWFRGAAESVGLDCAGKSMVVYGENGSGKSSFVDAVEYLLHHGKIGHLTHEYSGKHQEKALSNTLRPAGCQTEIDISFMNGSEVKARIAADGSSTTSGAKSAALETWDYRRTVLRQDEVSAFIHETKGGKYSALLPLLGLSEMEVAAENLRQLAKMVEQVSKVVEIKSALREVELKRKAAFGTSTHDQILKRIADLHTAYCPDKIGTGDPVSRCDDLEAAIGLRIARFSTDEKRYLVLRDIAQLPVQEHVDTVRAAAAKLSGTVEPLITERLDVLRSARGYADRLEDKGEVKCPACGQAIEAKAFRAHVEEERARLQETIRSFDTWKAAIGTLCDTVKSLKSAVLKSDVSGWRDELAIKSPAGGLEYLQKLDLGALRTSCREEDLKAIEAALPPLVKAAASSSKDAPADVQQLSTDNKSVESGKAVITGGKQAAVVSRAEALVAFLHSLEHGIRDEIRLRSQAVIDGISTDIQVMWAILHPGEAIEDVHLYIPKDTEKAIDIGLKFFGVARNSPRLTLSEGYRNSLGLCIFLAMAKREAEKDRPVLLDDVVVSMDRHHRGMIVEVLEKMFAERQVVIFTHDRDWYAELRLLLDGKAWAFKALLPYETPEIGIRWSHKTTTFDDARAHLKDRPDSAGNDARKIMDVEMMPIAERLRIRVEYLRGEKNDKRLSHDLLERVVAQGRACFEKRAGSVHTVHGEAIEALAKADALLVAWANRASHSFDIVPPEAAKLIDACEAALGFFKCPTCGKNVWYADAERAEVVQCECGEIRWRYGKG